jgi:hypothetical protein
MFSSLTTSIAVVASRLQRLHFGNQAEPLEHRGHLSSGGYLPVTQGRQYSGTRLTMIPVLAGHALLEGVSPFNGGSKSFHNNVSVANGATLVTNWSNGRPLVAYKDNGVALNFYPPSSDSRSDFWLASTDGAQLLANSLMCDMYL